MFKKVFSLFLVAVLIFQTLGDFFIFAEENDFSESVEIMEEKDILEEEISPEENIVEKAEILDIYMEDSLKEEDLLPMATLNSGSLTLKITEVYPWSANERIEITNFGEEAFSGILTIKTNAGNSNTSTGMVELAAHTSLLIVNMTITGIHTEDIIIINASKDFTITDTKEAVIQIFYEEKFLDKFEVSLSDMTTSANKNKNKSFERYFNTASGTIQATTSDHLSHNLTGFSINPWKVFGNQLPWDFPIIPDAPTEQENPSYDNSKAQLVISEVFYDSAFVCTARDIQDWGCDETDHEYYPDEEWIEIFNFGSWAFSGTITLSGQIFSGDMTSYSYSVFIPTGGFLVLADKQAVFEDSFTDATINSTHKFPDFDIPDTSEILIDLIIDEQVVDNFFVHQYWVEYLQGYRESLHKIFWLSGTIVSRASTNDTVNLKWSRLGNPGIPYDYEESDNPLDFAYADGKRPPKIPDHLPNEKCDEALKDLLTISEVFRWSSSGLYQPYIEFFLHEDMENTYDALLLSGSLLEKSLEINLDHGNDIENVYERSQLQKNTRLIVTNSDDRLANAWLLTVVYHSGFVLKDMYWGLEVYWLTGQNRQLLDIVDVLTWQVGKSTYDNYGKYGSDRVRACGDPLTYLDDFSPGFGEEVLEYFSPTADFNIKIIEVPKYSWGGWGCVSSASSKELPITNGTGVITPIEESKVTDDDPSVDQPEPLLTGKTLKILAIEPKSPESITLQSFLPYDIDFTKHTLYLKTSTATTKKYIDGTLSANSVDTFTKNFGFLDAGACVSLYSGDILLDTICYTAETAVKESEKKAETPTFIPADYQVKILDILYDPDGADTDNETITLQNLSSQILDLSFLKLKINTTNKKLTGILNPGEIKTFKGTFGFPNSTKSGEEVMVSLFYDTTIFDTYFYNPNTPKIVAQSGEVKVYSVLDGDTFRFRKEDGTLQSVRLLGVDAPESTTTRYRHTECFGTEAKTYLTNLIKNKSIRLEYDPTQQQVDSYGRLLAYVYLGEVLVNEKMLTDGYAKEYTYKSAYQFQSAFQSAEKSAKAKNVWLWSASTCWVSIEEVPEARGFDYDKLPLKITSLEYDPEGSDKDNETVILSLDLSAIANQNGEIIQSISWIDFSDNFKLTIFPWGEYATWTTKNKSLESFWFLPLADTFTFKGDFALPNTKATCVSLKYKEYTFDTKCYNPWMDEELLLSWEIISSELPAISIRSLLPNPSGKDSEKEEITLLRSEDSDSLEELNLSPDFYLLINNKTKKKLNGILLPNQEITIKGSFSFPNTASCVTLMKGTNPIDSFCYGKAGEGVRFSSTNVAVSEIPDEELALVKKITLVKKLDQLCISYNKVLFGCKKIPNSTTEKNTKLLSFQNNYIAELEKYLKNNYSLLYYESDLRELFALYTATKKEIKAGWYTFTRKWATLPLTDVASVLSTQYHQSASEYLVSSVAEHLPISLVAYYQQEKTKWYEELSK